MFRPIYAVRILVLILIGSWQLAPAQSTANQGSPVVLSSSQAALELWNDVGRRVIAMAEDFPEEKYDYRPNPVQRTFAEQLLHIAGSNDLFTDVAKGKKPTDDESRAHYQTKAAVVAYVKKSFAEGAAMIKEKGDAGLAQTAKDSESGEVMPLLAVAYEMIEHSGEHYGQLVVYYRSAGLVPPESRPKK